jgi:hypothetical protein
MSKRNIVGFPCFESSKKAHGDPTGHIPHTQSFSTPLGLEQTFSLLNEQDRPISASFLAFRVNIQSDSRQTSIRVLVNIKPPSLEHYPFAAKFS